MCIELEWKKKEEEEKQMIKTKKKVPDGNVKCVYEKKISLPCWLVERAQNPFDVCEHI